MSRQRGSSHRRLHLSWVILPVCLALSTRAALAANAIPDRIDFNYHIKPLLSDRCYACHGPDEKSRKAKLRLDTKEGAFKALEDGQFVIKPGDLAKSELVRRITSTDPEEVMPPPKSNLTLSPDEVDLLRRWVQAGAEWKKHWSFISLSPTAVPAVRDSAWPRNDLDRFILARLEAERLHPAPEAARERLLRRLTFDLTGLPPAIEEMDAFLADASPQAYERAVDRLLASPARGERLAVEWLDVARYADTFGYQSDRESNLWPWRDWVIRAFSQNLRFDDFIVWQIAGDLLPGATREQRLATGFNRNHRQTNEGGSVDEEFRVEYNADRVHTTAGAFLGLTMECARCHDHKYDPISQKDYYRLFAFFNSTDEAGLYSHFTDATPTPALLLFKNDAEERSHKELNQAIAAKEKALSAALSAARGSFEKWGSAQPELPPLRGLIGHYSFEQITSNTVVNLAGTNHPAKLVEAPQPVPGKFGQALRFTGENSLTVEKLADFTRADAFSFSCWIQIAEELSEIVLLHHQQAGSDAAYHGYQLVLEDGRASFALVHFWPGNALKLRTRAKLPLHQWLHLGVTYDGSSRAAGVALFVNGEPVPTEIINDRLRKDFANGAPLTFGARFRGRGFKDGLLDELKVFNRALAPLEMAAAASLQPWPPSPPPDSSNPRSPATPADLWFDYYLANEDQNYARVRSELQELRRQENALINRVPEIMAMGDQPTVRPTYVLKRGAYDARGEVVEAATPASILPLDPAWPRNRLGLARWLVDPKNPLPARVLVNRYWQLFFGRGLVVTAEDFGSQGALPSHPELLDWLASSFIASGWDLRALQKLMVLSATYRQSSVGSPELLARDPDNKLLARGPKSRLTAEMLRDGALEAAGLLVRRVGGPSVKPYQPEGLWEEKSAGWRYEADKGEGRYRRSLYTYWRRTSPHPMMTTFDAAERNTCVVRRQSTSTPLQALVLLNDPEFVEAARCLARRALAQAGPASDTDRRINFVFRSLTSRRPSQGELAVLRRLHQEQLDLFRNDRASAETLVNPSASGQVSDPAELAAYTALASAVMNFDESLFKR